MYFPSVSVGFPVYNEERSIAAVLTEAHQLLSKSGLDYEILVCNDGSKDRSPSIVEEIARRIPSLRVINHKYNLGIRATFERLYAEAAKEFVFINAADQQWETRILFDMLPLTEKGDIVVANRKKKPYGIFRNFISWGFNAAPLLIFGVRTFDAGSVKLVKREIIERFQLISKSPFSEAERLIRASKAGYRIVNYPVSSFPRKGGLATGAKPKIVLKAFIDIFRVWCSIYCLKK